MNCASEELTAKECKFFCWVSGIELESALFSEQSFLFSMLFQIESKFFGNHRSFGNDMEIRASYFANVMFQNSVVGTTKYERIYFFIKKQTKVLFKNGLNNS